jgi:protein TonB
VLLPERFSASPDAIRRAAVTHELFHVQRRDWLSAMAEEALRAVFWFHPAIWWMTSRIQQAREEFIDHLAVLATGSRRAYIDALLFFADGPSFAPASAFARRPHLFHRIVLLSKENVMSSRRIVISGVALASILVAGGWYSSEAFPLRPSRSAAAMVTAPAVQQTGVNVVTPENPIPRRISAPAVPYPLDLAGTGFSATVQMQVMLDVAGSVTARHTSVRFGGIQPTSDLERERAVAVFAAAATQGVAAWRYEPPFNAPLAFSMALRFTAGEAATVTQSETGPGGRSGAGEAVPLRIQETLTVGQPSSVHAGAGFAQTKHVDPIYPEAVRSARVSGVVILEASIDVQGRVSDVRVLRSVPLLDRAALDAVRQWEYAPTLLNGAPVPVIMTVTMQFLPQP